MKNETLIFIHGLWMNGMDMSLIEHRFKKDGFTTSRFHYKSVSDTSIDNARKLTDHINTISADQIHFVCHSLGGLVLRQCLHSELSKSANS
ncbi:MAG: alpha/beta hydrolase [Proteobacteria bacterium]|nr:alpha/beta hydrolase [Pseudomonadota bacterium]